MAIYRRTYRDKQSGELITCDPYSYDFIFHGRRYRGTTDYTSKTRAKAYVDDLRKRLERGLAGMPTEEPEKRVRTVAEALDDYESHYAVDHAKRSADIVKERGVHLRRLLGPEIAAALTESRMQKISGTADSRTRWPAHHRHGGGRAVPSVRREMVGMVAKAETSG